MPGPRADWSCRQCGKVDGLDGDLVIPDLPVDCKRCPRCGFKRGFRRLFNAVNVSTNGHRVAMVLDPVMDPHINGGVQARDEAKAAERRIEADKDKFFELSTPEGRERLAKAGQLPGSDVAQWTSAKPALGLVPADARADSRSYTAPHINRTVMPTHPISGRRGLVSRR